MRARFREFTIGRSLGELKANKREIILRAGSEIASDSGIAHVTASSVCKKIGVKPAGVYYHFPSNLELQLAVLAMLLQMQSQSFEQRWLERKSHNLFGVGALAEYLSERLTHAFEHPERVLLGMEAFVLAKRTASPALKELLKLEQGKSRIEGFLKDGVIAKQLDLSISQISTQARVLHLSLVASCQFLAGQELDKESFLQFKSETIAFIIKSLK